MSRTRKDAERDSAADSPSSVSRISSKVCLARTFQIPELRIHESLPVIIGMLKRENIRMLWLELISHDRPIKVGRCGQRTRLVF